MIKRQRLEDEGSDDEIEINEIYEKENVGEEEILIEANGFEFHEALNSYNCTHEVCRPPGWIEPEITIENSIPAKTFPFKLDTFQEAAIGCVQKNQSVLVSAHTSAGKTVIAQYAIALAFKNKQRVIYTSPIKALSNQKYSEFAREFKDVGSIIIFIF
jgi:ATP-dependent RNA helicase DOB1